jgi:hypothetical protein
MAKFLPAVLAIGAMAAINMAPSAAQARDYPFCIRGPDFASPVGDCSFDTFQQCQASASGRLASCAPNPWYANTPPTASSMRRRGQY